ncbi:protein lethal(2)essential for life-like [Portunus trituberculatus]|uniref:protein lethal(2)essential for life-like n=1 Tax=Portunus trituberculatus TaxID=210409 RepID=UPI001E1CB934|nr:protein lethal(2)essential for life-like [Portunus trituberculatus]XP_045118943.1 protein lethal(2)essential for life-like [Portunus trituberculatus]XP_045118953.1 protein lethal(2)essential for life-like [Portunus trituberculatus]
MSSTTTTKTTKTLSVVKRESFFDDSFFTDQWEDFDKAVQSVLDKFDDSGLQVDVASRSKCRDVYSKIRSSKIDEDLYASQALQITEKDGKFQAVMDVKDFSPSDLQVRVVEDRVVVEGKYIKKSEDGSSMSSKSFYKEFTMPNTADIDAVSTALSKDGVLTVRAPKREGGAATPSGALSTSVQQSQASVQQSSSSTSSVQQSSSSVKKVSMSSSSTFSSTSTSSNFSGMDSFDDMAKDMQDRLVFSHDNVNLKLPGTQ